MRPTGGDAVLTTAAHVCAGGQPPRSLVSQTPGLRESRRGGTGRRHSVVRCACRARRGGRGSRPALRPGWTVLRALPQASRPAPTDREDRIPVHAWGRARRASVRSRRHRDIARFAAIGRRARTARARAIDLGDPGTLRACRRAGRRAARAVATPRMHLEAVLLPQPVSPPIWRRRGTMPWRSCDRATIGLDGSRSTPGHGARRGACVVTLKRLFYQGLGAFARSSRSAPPRAGAESPRS